MYGTGSIVAVAIIVPAVAVIVPTVNEYCSRCCCAVVVNDSFRNPTTKETP